MCQAIRFPKNEFSEEVLINCKFQCIDEEVRVYFAHREPLLPIIFQGEHQLVKWGNRADFRLPKTGFCKKESLDEGKWRWLQPLSVPILASSALVNGVWFQVREGIQGLLLKDGVGKNSCFMVTQPSTHYFKTMTGAERMPVLINQIL